ELGLAGKTVIITGGSSNIGRGVVLAFAQEKSNVVIADIDEAQGQKTLELARKLGAKVSLLKTDLTRPEQCEWMVDEVLNEFGRIDVLVNSAGWVSDRLFIEKPREEWGKEVDINYWSVINCVEVVIHHMIAQNSGKIVSIASDAGKIGEYREVVYAGAKAAIIGFSKSLAREVGRYNINVNVVCPATVVPASDDAIGQSSLWRSDGLYYKMTEETKDKMAKSYPLRRLGRAEDIANAVVFLASDAASWITGQALSVDGGYCMA
ncbi:MAG: glucose 1-dehydrogenase, partial [Chloroflexi bacterium]|nr:glucose 1-dehydrogenase [Chloroflexota bacterium]